MPNQDELSSLTQRLDRIEKALARLSPSDAFSTVADPPPDDFVRARPDLANIRLIDLIRQLVPHGDPPPNDFVREKGSLVEMRLADILQRNPGWFVDPPPDDFLNVRIVDLIRRWRGGFTDPAPEDLANVRLRDLMQRIPGGGFTDPSPEDFGRLTRPELESLLHKVNAETLKLRSFERMIEDRLSSTQETMKKS